MTVRIESPPFLVDPVRLISLPITVDVNAANVEHGLGAPWGPVHAGSFHAVLDQVPTGAFDHTASNRIAGRQVLVVTHPIAVLFQVAADLRYRLLLPARQAVLGGHLPQA